ncbi:TonB-dependent receptor [Pedomonas sp. V897]|uniref:TonB-dependent receptor n=1 Tax=Pedomonas sp. V897 TaxID=3446482 RepID=UPI003EE34490
MSSTNLVLHRALLKAGVATALMAAASPAIAQQQAETTTMETIVVTGSRIARPELQASSPVAVVGAEEFKFSGATHVEEVLHELPQVIPSLGATSNNPGDGVSTVDLRGLGATRTLVLVNGRRYVSYDEQQVVDLNTIPTALIERVDVVTGGRSAVYGSDAIAGVVNFVLKQDFEGVQVGGSYRLNEKGDGDTYTVDGIIGGNFADGKGNITAYMSYSKRKGIMADARSYTRNVLSDDGAGNIEFGGSAVIPNGLIINGNDAWIADNGNLLPYDGSTYNYAPDNYLQTPNERWFIGAFAKYEINEHAEVFAEMQYINSRAQTELAPTPVTGNFDVSVDNPFLTESARNILRAIDANEKANANAGINPNDGVARVAVYRRMNEAGPRHQLDDRNAFRALIGLRGDIAAGWAYEGYYSYARNRNIQTQDGNISRSKFQQALLTNGNACVNTSGGCVPLNIFGLGVANPDGVNFVTLGSTNLNEIQSQVASFTVNNGELFDLGAGPVGIALGAEWRSERGSYRPDTYLSSGDVIGFNAGEPTKGGYSVKEFFGELIVPLLSDLPAVHKLEFNGAVRYADYSSAVGSAWAYSAGLMYAPIEDITFRGQYQRAVRAPTVNQLFAGQSVSFPAATDPCQTPEAASNPTLRQTCLANGFPAASIGKSLPGANSQIQSRFGGNPDLHEEKADTYTIGAVIQPRFLPRFSLTVDYYNIKIEDYIASPGTPAIIAACYGNADSNFTPYDPAMCALAPRNPLSGLLEDVVNLNANLGELKTSGIDFEARYFVNVPFGVDNDGRLDFRLSGTRLINWKLNTVASIPSLLIECDGAFGANCGNVFPKWRWNFRTTYSTGPASVSFNWHHIGSARDDDEGTTYWREKVGSYDIFDLAASYELNETISFTAGVNNLFNRKPPLIGDGNNEQSNTYPTTYDVFGRQYFFSATAKF